VVLYSCLVIILPLLYCVRCSRSYGYILLFGFFFLFRVFFMRFLAHTYNRPYLFSADAALQSRRVSFSVTPVPLFPCPWFGLLFWIGQFSGLPCAPFLLPYPGSCRLFRYLATLCSSVLPRRTPPGFPVCAGSDSARFVLSVAGPEVLQYHRRGVPGGVLPCA